MKREPPERERVITEAARTGVPIRMRMTDGEVVVARVLEAGPEELVYAVVTSSRPEKYAMCDATGFVVPLEAIGAVSIVAPSARSSRRRPR